MDKKYTVTGMTCSACSARVEHCVGKIDGVEQVTVNLISGVMTVRTEKDLSEEIERAVKGEGYGIKAGAEHRRGSAAAQKMKKRLIVSVPLVLLLVYVSMGDMLKLPTPYFFGSPLISALLQFALCTPVLIINSHFFVSGFKKLFTGAPNMDSLIALGSSVSYLYSLYSVVMIIAGNETYRGSLFFEGAAMILTFITVGKYLEERSKNKTMGAIEKLLSLAPDTAIVIRDGKETQITAAELVCGDEVVLKDGSTVPADGEIISGGGWFDEAVITGESIPVYKTVGDKAICGTGFGGGHAIFRAESVGEDSTVYKIVKLVEDANSTKVPVAKAADKVAGIFVPSVMAIALCAFFGWLLIGASTVDFAVNAAVSVLVVSCPCALGLATPAALMAGTGKAAEKGILIKSGEALEMLEKVDTVVLDKTGTITFGKPEVDDYRLIEGFSDEKFLALCASLEGKSSHVLGAPIIALASERGYKNYDVSGFESVAGEGIKGVIEGKLYMIGNLKMMSENGVDTDITKEYAEKKGAEGCTVLYVAEDDKAIGCIAIKDKIKPSSKRAVEEFEKEGIEVVMLTGDSEAAASAVAGELGISYRAGVLPQDKHEEIKKLTASGKKTVMIGDGVNDAPALCEASVGMAIGAGTDVAIESADVVLIKNDLTDAASAIRLGRATMRNIKENLFWAFFYNVILIPIACGALVPLGVKMNPMFAAAAMSLSSIFVVGNALRLRLFRFEKNNNKEKGEKTEMDKVKVYVDGMMCEHCKKRVEGVLSGLGLKAEVDLKEKCAYVSGDIDEGKIKAAVEQAGYTFVGIKE
ncbi:MAG: heavy metal translocating P-type ATPase [Clostridia bacterium]|nr:heavy metal translocating P-type ATPase [Clostridia bacterium]